MAFKGPWLKFSLGWSDEKTVYWGLFEVVRCTADRPEGCTDWNVLPCLSESGCQELMALWEWYQHSWVVWLLLLTSFNFHCFQVCVCMSSASEIITTVLLAGSAFFCLLLQMLRLDTSFSSSMHLKVCAVKQTSLLFLFSLSPIQAHLMFISASLHMRCISEERWKYYSLFSISPSD